MNDHFNRRYDPYVRVGSLYVQEHLTEQPQNGPARGQIEGPELSRQQKRFLARKAAKQFLPKGARRASRPAA